MAAKINDISDEDLIALAKQRLGAKMLRAVAEEAKAEEAERVRANAFKVKADVEKYVQETYGMSLQQIFTARDPSTQEKAVRFKNPADWSIWTLGRGRKPGRLKGNEDNFKIAA